MGKVYSGVEGIKKPDFMNITTYDKEAEAYVKKIVFFAQANGSSAEAGKIIRFSVADGKAQYVVFSLKPVVLIHLDIYDGYQFEYANKLTATDVKREIRRQEALEKLFGGRK